MEKFKFKPYNSSIDAGVFTMGNGYFESSGEADTRKQLSYPLSNIADYINDEVVPSVNESINSIQELRTDVKTTTDSLKNELGTCKNDVSLLNGRVDTVTSLPSGSTTGDAELADIRVGANGTTYPNAGGAVRGQINELKSDLSDLKVDRNDVISIRKNYFNKELAIDNRYYDSDVGSVIEARTNGDYWCGIVEVEPHKTYKFSRSDYNIIELDANKIKLLNGTDGSKRHKFSYTVQNENTKYIAFSVYKYVSGDIPKYTPNDYMVIDSDESFDEYIPFPKTVTYNMDYVRENGIATDEEIADLANRIYNYFNKEDSVLGHYYEASVGSVIEAISNDEYWGGIIKVDKGKTYVFARLNYVLCELDKDKKVLSKKSYSNYSKEVSYTPTSNGVEYVSFNVYKYGTATTPVYTPNDYMVLDENIDFISYISYPYEVRYNTDALEKSGATIEKIYYVGEGKDFDTFVGALRALKDDKTPKTIYVMNGVYDIYSELGGKNYLDTISASADWKSVSVFVPDNTKIIGLGDVTFNYLPDASDFSNANQVTCVSPLNVVWNCEIENIKINARNCRYCIHDEAGSMGDGIPKRKKYKNVVAIKLPNTYHPSESYISGQAYASGMITGYSYEYENCYFKSQENYALTCHTGEGDYTDTGNVIEIKNCIFESPSWAGIRFGSTQGTPTGIQKYCKVSILNSYIQNQILLTREADTAPAPNQYELTLMNCNNVTITDKFAENGWTNIYTPKVFNPIG